MRPSLLVSIMLMVAVMVPAMVHAECPSPERVAEAASVYFANELAAAYTGLTVEDAYCAQRRYVALLERRLGPRGGYKVGFTSRVSQEMYGVKEPARGVMFRSMFLESGVVLNANFGKRPFREADLVVKVKDEGINTARTLLEVARHLDEVIPFIELPNMVLAKGEPFNVPEAIAYNMAARLGVVGRGITVQPTQEFVDAFAEMDVIMTNDKGEELLRTKGSALMGNPLNVVLWLVENLRQHGMELRAGDLISLGRMGGFGQPQPGRTITLRYEGLPGGNSDVSVTFR